MATADNNREMESDQFIFEDEESKDGSNGSTRNDICGDELVNGDGGQADTFSSRQWPQSYRETTDSFTIAASPIFVTLLRVPSLIRTSFENHSKSNLDLDPKTSLLSDYERACSQKDLGRISKTQSSWLEKSPLQKQQTGELPISHACSFTQTVFNVVNVMAGVGLLSTPSTVKEAGWAGLGVLVLSAVLCCYTASLMKQCLESIEGVLT